MFHPYRYFIAAGASLSAIETFLAEEAAYSFEESQQEQQKLEHGLNVKAGLYSDTGISYSFINNQPPAKGWRKNPLRNGYFEPDPDTQEGRELLESFERFSHEKGDAQVGFAKWLGAYDVDTAPGAIRIHEAFGGNSSARFEKLGNDYVISVPVVQYGDGEDWISPPDSMPLSVSGYFQLQEKQGILSLEPTSQNHLFFNQGRSGPVL